MNPGRLPYVTVRPMLGGTREYPAQVVLVDAARTPAILYIGDIGEATKLAPVFAATLGVDHLPTLPPMLLLSLEA